MGYPRLSIDYLKYLLHLLIPGRNVLLARSSANIGNYTFLVERVVDLKIVAHILEHDFVVGKLLWGGFGAWHVDLLEFR